MNKKQNVGNRQQSGQDKEIYGEVPAFEGPDNTINAGEAGEQNNRKGRLYWFISEKVKICKVTNANKAVFRS